MYLYVHVGTDASEGQRRVLASLELKAQVLLSAL